MDPARKLGTVLGLALAVVVTTASYGAGWAWLAAEGEDGGSDATASAPQVQPAAKQQDPPQRSPEPSLSAEPEPAEEIQQKEPEPEPEPELQPGPRLLGPEDSGAEVREVQARLRQIDWFNRDVTDYYGPVTTEAVRGFQAKRGFPVTGYVDQRTLDRIHEMTTEPTAAELDNTYDDVATAPAGSSLDPRCTTGRVLCIDKTTNSLRWVVDGQVHTTLDARFGRDEMPTREGQFSVTFKSRDHVSSLYDTPMPYAMFFSGGQAVHYSPDFAAHGYNGASHGCVNIRDRETIAWLFGEVNVGDKVVVYWS